MTIDSGHEQMTGDGDTRYRNEKRDALAHALRVASANFVASTLAHDLSQPMTAINAWASSCLKLAEGGELTREKMKKLIERMTLLQGEAWRATDIIREFRKKLPRKEPVLEDVDINRVLSGLREVLEDEAHERRITFRLHLEKNLPAVRADVELVELAIYILSRNSLDSFGRRRRGGENITIRSRHSDPATVEVAVADSGPGVDAESGDALFRPFAGSSTGGMGVGLAICRTAIESLGGRIWLEQSSGDGTTFVFALPCATNGGGHGRTERIG